MRYLVGYQGPGLQKGIQFRFERKTDDFFAQLADHDGNAMLELGLVIPFVLPARETFAFDRIDRGDIDIEFAQQ